jgi:hypothetical protein
VEFDFLFSSSHAEVISGKQEGETESCEPDGNMVQFTPRHWSVPGITQTQTVCTTKWLWIKVPAECVYTGVKRPNGVIELIYCTCPLCALWR